MTTLTLTTTQLATITSVGAAVAPFIVSFLKQENWPSWAKQLIAYLTSAVITIVGLAITGDNFTVTTIFATSALIFLGSQAVYQTYFRGSAVDAALTGIMAKKPKTPTPAAPVVTPVAPATPTVLLPTTGPGQPV